MFENAARVTGCLGLAIAAATCISIQSATAEPFKLGVEQKNMLPGENPYQGQAEYPMPQAVEPMQGGVRQQAPMQAGVGRQAPMQGGVQRRPPMQANARRSVELPRPFLGNWLVTGRRRGFEAQPKYQAAIPQIFSANTRNIWTITGNPNKGYAFANKQGAKSPLYVNKVQGNTAFIRYGHPIKNTMAQEAIVMELSPDGRQFKGLERITIVKKGEPPRAKVTYEIVGVRQR